MKRAAAAGAACVGAPLRCYPAEPGRFPAELAAVLDGDLLGAQPAHGTELAAAGAGAAILADLAAGEIAATHEALDQHPRPRAAGYLRQMLVAGGSPAAPR